MASDRQRQFGKMLQERRENVLGKSQAEIGDETFASQKTVSARETGRTAIPLESLSDIAEAYQLRNVLSDIGTIYGVAPDMIPVAIDVTDRYEQLAQDYRTVGMFQHANAVRHLMRHAMGNPDTPGHIINIMTLTRPEYEAVTELRNLLSPDLPLDAYVHLLAEVMPSFDRGEEQHDEAIFEKEEDNRADLHDIACRYCPLAWCPGNRFATYGCHYDEPDAMLGGHTMLECMEEVIRTYADKKMMVPDIPEQAIHHVPSVADVLDRAPRSFVESFPNELDPYLWPELSLEDRDAMNDEYDGNECDSESYDKSDDWDNEDSWNQVLVVVYDQDGHIVNDGEYRYNALAEIVTESVSDNRTVLLLSQSSAPQTVQSPEETRQILDSEYRHGLRVCIKTATGVPIWAWEESYHYWDGIYFNSHFLEERDDDIATPVLSNGWDWEVWNGQVSVTGEYR